MFLRSGGVLLSAALLGGASATAQQGAVVFTRTGSGARAAGMANAFIAVSDDGTAASWNPAGLGQLWKPELSIVSTTLGQSVRVQGSGRWTTSPRSPPRALRTAAPTSTSRAWPFPRRSGGSPRHSRPRGAATMRSTTARPSR